MLPTLYDALGLREDASAERIRAALRGQIRKYCKETRDSEGAVEDALRLVDHAARVLVDPELRARYDADIAAAREAGSTYDDHRMAVGAADRPEPQASIPYTVTVGVGSGQGAQAARRGGLTEKVRALRGAGVPAVVAGLAVLVIVALAAVRLVPADTFSHPLALLLAVAMAIVLVAAVQYAVYLVLRWWWRGVARDAAPVIDLGAVGWRHRDSLFLGNVEARKDAGWLFDLRTAELDRARLQRTSVPHPWRRLAARLFDYGVWGVLLWLGLAPLSGAGAVPRVVIEALGQPLLAGVVITASWIPVEALALALLRTTPGKWLFGVHVQFAISDPQARHDRTGNVLRGLVRAVRVWIEGLAGGVVVLAPVAMAYARERLAVFGETRWDGESDCLVTHSPLTAVGAATGTAGLLAFAALYSLLWSPALDDALVRSRGQTGTVAPSATVAARGTPGVTDAGTGQGAALDAELEARFAQRRERIAKLSTDGLRQFDAHNYRLAAQLCGEWTDLEGSNVRAWLCLGRSLNALGQYRDAVDALKRAKQHAPPDPAIDAELARAERGLIEDFRRRAAR